MCCKGLGRKSSTGGAPELITRRRYIQTLHDDDFDISKIFFFSQVEHSVPMTCSYVTPSSWSQEGSIIDPRSIEGDRKTLNIRVTRHEQRDGTVREASIEQCASAFSRFLGTNEWSQYKQYPSCS